MGRSPQQGWRIKEAHQGYQLFPKEKTKSMYISLSIQLVALYFSVWPALNTRSPYVSSTRNVSLIDIWIVRMCVRREKKMVHLQEAYKGGRLASD